MIGYKSIAMKIKVQNVSNPKAPHKVIVQANKNYGICDFILPLLMVPPIKPIKYTKESYRAYKEARLEYDSYMNKRNAKRQELLNMFQGRQLNDAYIVERVKEVMFDVLNVEEL